MRLPSILPLLILLTACQPTETEVKKTTGPVTDAPYQEAHRNQYHFSPDSMWMNDPNGMVYYEGEYHLFYQYYPDSNVWGPMHWGHAVSPDLVHWEHLPIALYPDSLGYIFSGSAVIDWDNTSGFGDGETPPMVAIFTYHDIEGERAGRNDFQYQGIAYSLDRGRSFTKYDGNPVVPNPGIKDFRDPKVIWDEDSRQWVMVFAAWDHLKLYGSPDLKSWTHLSDFGQEWGSHEGVWECPDLFPMTNETTGEKEWVLLVSVQKGSPNGGTGAQYFVGNFDGRDFKVAKDFEAAVRPDELVADASINRGERTVWLDYGRDNYAGVTWSDVPETDGRRLFLGWMSNWQYAQETPTERWRSAMTLPRSLRLVSTEEGPRLLARPVKELDRLATDTIVLPGADGTPTISGRVNQSKWTLRFDPAAAPEVTEFALELSNEDGETILVGYEPTTRRYFTDRRNTQLADFNPDFATKRHYAPRVASASGPVEMTVFVDHASLEVFAHNGGTLLTDIYFAASPLTTARIYAEGGKVSAGMAEGVALKSIW